MSSILLLPPGYSVEEFAADVALLQDEPTEPAPPFSLARIVEAMARTQPDARQGPERPEEDE